MMALLTTVHWRLTTHPGAVAQLGERLPCTEEVGGSSPPSSTQRDDFYLTLPSGIQILGIEDWVDRIAAEVAA